MPARPLVEPLLIAWLGDALAVTAATELDNDLLADLPIVQVTRVGGGDDGFRLDRALVDIDVYAATQAGAATLMEDVRGALLGTLRGSTLPGAVVGLVRTVSAPARRPYENTGLRRYGATFEIFLHPVS